MKIFIFEYITGGGMLGQAIPASLAREGDMMLQAAVKCFSSCNDAEVMIFRDYRLPYKNHDIEVVNLNPQAKLSVELDNIAQQVDAILVIAPESDGFLYSICKQLSNFDCAVLNCSLECIALTSDKYKTYTYFKNYSVPQIPTYKKDELNSITEKILIMKPVDGVGCEYTYIGESREQLLKFLKLHPEKEFIFQPYIEGVSASISLMCWEDDFQILSVNEQIIEVDNEELTLNQCHVNAIDPGQFKEFVKQLVKNLRGLRGYVGVDVLVTGKEILLVEINPRLTTSFAGLHAALGVNTADALLKCFQNNKLHRIYPNQNKSIYVHLETGCAA